MDFFNALREVEREDYEESHHVNGFPVARLREAWVQFRTAHDPDGPWRAVVRRSMMDLVLVAAGYFYGPETTRHVEYIDDPEVLRDMGMPAGTILLRGPGRVPGHQVPDRCDKPDCPVCRNRLAIEPCPPSV